MASEIEHGVVGAGTILTDSSMFPRAGGNAALDDTALLRLYIGRNADVFLRIDEALKKIRELKEQKAPFSHRFKWGRRANKMNWAVLLTGPVWFFYRKLWLEGILFIVAAVAVGAYLPDHLARVLAPCAVFGGLANSYYLRRARKHVRAIEAMPLPVEERDQMIRRRGGVSMAGMAVSSVGLAAVAALVFVPLIRNGPGTNRMTSWKLPLCTSADVQKLVNETLEQTLREKKLSTAGLSTRDYRELSGPPDQRSCTMTVTAPGYEAPFMARISWRDRAKGIYQVNFAPLKQ